VSASPTLIHLHTT